MDERGYWLHLNSRHRLHGVQGEREEHCYSRPIFQQQCQDKNPIQTLNAGRLLRILYNIRLLHATCRITSRQMKSGSLKSPESQTVLLLTDPTFISVSKFMAQIWWSDCKLLECINPLLLLHTFWQTGLICDQILLTSNPHLKEKKKKEIFHWHLCYDLLNWPERMAVQYLCCTLLHTLTIATIGPFIAFWFRHWLNWVCTTWSVNMRRSWRSLLDASKTWCSDTWKRPRAGRARLLGQARSRLRARRAVVWGAWKGPPEVSAESLTSGDVKAELRTEGWVSLVTREDTNQWALFWSP